MACIILLWITLLQHQYEEIIHKNSDVSIVVLLLQEKRAGSILFLREVAFRINRAYYLLYYTQTPVLSFCENRGKAWHYYRFTHYPPPPCILSLSSIYQRNTKKWQTIWQIIGEQTLSTLAPNVEDVH